MRSLDRVSCCIVMLLILCYLSESSNTIIFYPTLISRGSAGMFIAMAEALVARGDTVTVVTAFRNTDLNPGIKQIVVDGALAVAQEAEESYTFSESSGFYDELTTTPVFRNRIVTVCRSLLNHPGMQRILMKRETFHVAIIIWYADDCALGIVNYLHIPFIYFTTDYIVPEGFNNLRYPSCTSYSPMIFDYDFPSKMTFMERLQNSITMFARVWIRETYLAPAIDQVLQEKFGNGIPSVLSIERNVSLMVINNHYSITYPRAILPNMIYAPCVHCRAAKTLEPELERWIDESGENGFIYFSFGTFIPAHKMSTNLTKAFVQAFSNIRQRVLWKTKLNHIDDLPSNVRIYKWFDQQDVLGHPKLKLFITHGGLLSVLEATYHGVPMLGIPTRTDQPFNMRMVEEAGAGIKMKWHNVNASSLQQTMNRLLLDTSYKRKAEERKKLLRNLQATPMQTMMYWIDYVIEYKGAAHLRSEALNLTWYQYYQLDILILLLGVLFLLLLMAYFIFQLSLYFLLRK